MNNSTIKRAVLSERSANYTPQKELSPYARTIIVGMNIGGENVTKLHTT
jgi:hypothetical protein